MADIRAYNNYYPFGMLQPERHWSTEDYRYGYNGKEMDNEMREEPTTGATGTRGTGNHYDYGFRVYDPRIGKFLSVDPLTNSFPWWTPYQFAGNTPVMAIDLDGLELLLQIDKYYEFDQSTNAAIEKFDIENAQENIEELQSAVALLHNYSGFSSRIRRSYQFLNADLRFGQEREPNNPRKPSDFAN